MTEKQIELPQKPTHIFLQAGVGSMAAAIASEPSLAGIKKEPGLDGDSRILFFSTEGATDRENYRKIVWDGALSE